MLALQMQMGAHEVRRMDVLLSWCTDFSVKVDASGKVLQSTDEFTNSFGCVDSVATVGASEEEARRTSNYLHRIFESDLPQRIQLSLQGVNGEVDYKIFAVMVGSVAVVGFWPLRAIGAGEGCSHTPESSHTPARRAPEETRRAACRS